MSLIKARKRLVEKLKKQDDKRLSKIRAWELFQKVFLETSRVNLERLMNAGSPFRGGRDSDGVSWRIER